MPGATVRPWRVPATFDVFFLPHPEPFPSIGADMWPPSTYDADGELLADLGDAEAAGRCTSVIALVDPDAYVLDELAADAASADKAPWCLGWVWSCFMDPGGA